MLVLLLVAGMAPAGVSDEDDYLANVRVFMVEPTSRWTDGLGNPYGFGFLDFALDSEVEIKEYDTWQQTTSWSAIAAGFSGTTPSNMMAIAVVFNHDSSLTDAFPGYGYWFWAHYVDATAAATTTQPGDNTPVSGFTHTEFIEQAGSGA